jgi:hypothetical protein
VLYGYTQNAPPKKRIWQDRSGVTRKDKHDIGVEDRRKSDIVVVGGRFSYIASKWCIRADVLT